MTQPIHAKTTFRPMGESDGTISSTCRVCGTRIEYRCTFWESDKPSEWQGYCPTCEAGPDLAQPSQNAGGAGSTSLNEV